MNEKLLDDLREELKALGAADRYRFPATFAGPSRSSPTLVGALAATGGPLLSFSSNDYLGLAGHPALVKAATYSFHATGLGSGASRLVSGQHEEHLLLERRLARHFEHPAALLFPTGYQTNLGVITTLASRHDLIASDAGNHASLIDGCRLSRASVSVYPHRDADTARRILREGGKKHRRRFIVTESLFSMDGDCAPLRELADIARDHDAVLIVDEAHAVGALGPQGRGLCAAQGVEPDVLIGTLGKAFGAFGGFACGSAELREILVNRARTFVFTTAPPPGLAAAATAAVELVASPFGDDLRARLQRLVAELRGCLSTTPTSLPESPILPVVFGADAAALAASRELGRQGLFVQAIRPPTVPEGTARLRVTLSAAHSVASVQALGAALQGLR